VTKALVAGAYAALGALLVGTRLYGLDRGYWHDEIVTVADFVRAGPREILTGAYIANNHELFSLLGWATSTAFGESEVALRLWSVVPFLLGVGLVTAWLHARVSPLSGVLFLVFATLSPLLLDLSRQARGYGIAFCAMGALVVGALEATRSGRTWPIAAVCAAGVAGTWTLPNFAIAFASIAAVLLIDAATRRRMAFGLGPSVLAIGAWYAGNIADVVGASRQDSGFLLDGRWLVTAPIDQILLPALLWVDGSAVDPGVLWLPAVIAALVLMGSSPLVRNRTPALVLASGPIVTIVALWVTETQLVPRFLSFLLVPLLVLTATGAASVLERLPGRPAFGRTAIALAALVTVTVAFIVNGLPVVELPREAHKNAVDAIREHGWDAGPVFAYALRPRDLAFYLGRTPRAGVPPRFASVVCSRATPVVLVVDPWLLPPASFLCSDRHGTQHLHFEQYARGDGIDVWRIPPAS
jgi:hypothetical protein